VSTPSKPPRKLDLASVTVDDDRLAPPRPHTRELPDSLERVDRVATQEVLGALDRTADALVLVTPVRLALRTPRQIEIEVCRKPGRARRPREHDSQDIGVLVLVGEGAEAQQLLGCARREPVAHVARRRLARFNRLDLPHRVADLRLQAKQVVVPRLHLHEQAVEGGDIDADGVVAALQPLDDRCARAGERIEHATSRRDGPFEQHLDELGDELPEVRVEPVDVLRALTLR